MDITTQLKKSQVLSVQILGTKKYTSNSYGKNLQYMSYSVYCLQPNLAPQRIEDIFTKEELKDLSYWSPRSDTMAMTFWGTSQRFEAVLALTRFFRPQVKPTEDWPTYTRRAEKFVTVI